MKAITLLFSLLSLASSQLFAQGSLEPAGAPAPTMKTLQQIEPRIPVSGPGTLSASGSYYLTQDIADSITLGADNISLDLNGFSINAGSPGIEIGAHSHVQIFNGRIQNNPKDSGIHAAGGGNVHIRDLTIYNHGRCIHATAVDGPFTIQNVTCDTIQLYAFQLFGNTDDAPSFRILDNTISNTSLGGKVHAMSIGHTGDNLLEVLMTGNRVLNSGINGIFLGASKATRVGVVTDNYVEGCAGTGITAAGDYIVSKNIVQGCGTAYALGAAANAAPVTDINFAPEPWDNVTDEGLKAR